MHGKSGWGVVGGDGGGQGKVARYGQKLNPWVMMGKQIETQEGERCKSPC